MGYLGNKGSNALIDSNSDVTFRSLTVGPGTSSKTPIDLAPGTLVTNPTSGSFEYDGSAFYATPRENNRGVLMCEHFVLLTSANTLTSQTAVQPLFDGGGGPANGRITLPVGTYVFECFFSLTSMSATSGSFGFDVAGTATKTYSWNSLAKDATLATASNAQITFNTAANTALCIASTATTGQCLIKGIIDITVEGTIIPQVSLTTAAAAVVGAGSYFRISQIGSDTATYVGNWS